MFRREGPGCVQGIDELTICNRLEGSDECPLEIQCEFRDTELTPDNHAFLHGQPTSKPGSWTNNKAMCDTKRCLDNLEAIAKYNSFEYEIYQNESKNRELVITDETDKKLAEDSFINAPTIFATNDNKYHVGKQNQKHGVCTIIYLSHGRWSEINSYIVKCKIDLIYRQTKSLG